MKAKSNDETLNFTKIIIEGDYNPDEMIKRFKQVKKEVKRRKNGLNYSAKFIKKYSLSKYFHSPYVKTFN